VGLGHRVSDEGRRVVVTVSGASLRPSRLTNC
jgi:hypothetical protein